MTGKEQTLFSLRAESPRYSRYEARIQAIGRMLDSIRHHRIAAALIAAAAIVLLLCFLGTVGTFMGAPSCQDFVYGEEPKCSAKAFLSDIRYQYAPAEGEAVWSDSAPLLPGTYRIRAVSKNGFGKPKYSQAMRFTLLPRELRITIHPASFVYGDFSLDTVKAHTEVEGLADGDRIADLEYTVTEDKMGNFTASVKKFRILNGAGEEVTGCYTVTAADGCFTMTPRPITVSAKDAQKVYDGQPWSAGAAELTDGTLADGDSLQTAVSSAPAEAGTYELVLTCAVRNGKGEDVTEYYQITLQSGMLTVFPRPISVRTGGGAKVYDETPLTNSEWSMTDGALIPGHNLTGETTGSQTAAGESPNTIKLTVLDAAGNDMTANYDFSVEAGTLTVTPITLKFETDSAGKVYDGNLLTESGCRLVEGKVLKGHTLTFSTVGGQRDVGSTPNALLVSVRNQAGVDVTSDGYLIQVDYGMLTVNRRPITVFSGSAEKPYDGTPLTCTNFNLIEGSLATGNGMEYMIPYFTGSQTEVGSSDNAFTVDIQGESGLYTTSNYEITYVYGTLTVHENPNPPSTGGTGGTGGIGGTGGGTGGTGGTGTAGGAGGTSGTGGTGIGKHGQGIDVGYPDPDDNTLYAVVNCFDKLESPTEVYFRDASYGDYTGTGWTAPKLYTTYSDSPLEYIGKVLYEEKKSIYLEIEMAEGNPRLFPYYSRIFYDLDEAEKDNDCYIVGDSSAYYGVNVTLGHAYQDLQYLSVDKTDRGEEEKYREFVYQQYLQIPESTKAALLQWAGQHSISANSPTLVQDIQTVIQNAAVYNPNGMAYPRGVDVAVYFLTEAKEGICQHFATAATLMYRAFGIPARYTVGFVDKVQYMTYTQLTSSDAHAWVEVYVDGLGWVPVEVTGSTAPEDRKTELHLKAYSAAKYYDGETFESYDLEQYTVLSGSLREGHRLAVSFETGKYATDPGTYFNRIVRCVVYDESGKDVTADYYNIYLHEGTLTVLPRKITVTLGSASKVYDGLPLTCPDYWISEGSLAPGDELVIELTSVLAVPGTVQNIARKLQIWGVTPYGNEVDVTHCYEIIVIQGILEITEEE